MKRKNLYLMCGIPGSGKSTWAKEAVKVGQKQNFITHYHSRDAVRYEMVPETDEYFSKEKEVFKEWIRRGRESLNDETVDIVIMDATHVNKASRTKTLKALDGQNHQIRFVVMSTPVSTCIQWNNKRQGRELVPPDVVMRMSTLFEVPSPKECSDWGCPGHFIGAPSKVVIK